jgi:hypothetical protein
MTADRDAKEEVVEESCEAPAEQGVLKFYPPTAGAHAAELGQCRTAFNSGDIGSARGLAQGVVNASDTSKEERGFAEMILERTALDPVAIGAGLGCFALFWFVIYWFLWR